GTAELDPGTGPRGQCTGQQRLPAGLLDGPHAQGPPTGVRSRRLRGRAARHRPHRARAVHRPRRAWRRPARLLLAHRARGAGALMGEVRLLPDDDVRLDEVTRWAADRLRDVLTARGVRVGDGPGVASDDAGIALRLAGAQDAADGETPRGPESFGLDRAADGTLTVTGADPRGLLDGVLELADAAEHADDPV